MLWGSPTSLNNFTLTLTGSGNTIDVSHVAIATNVSLYAAGGAQVALPLLTQIAEGSYNTLQANDTGSLLDLSQVTAITGSNQVTIQTNSGGQINLPNLTSITSGEHVYLNVSSGTINVTSVGGGTSNGGLTQRSFPIRAACSGAAPRASTISA